MSQLNKMSVKAALNMSTSCGWNVRPRLNISSQAHIGRVIAPDTSQLWIQSDSPVHIRFDRSTTIAAFTAVADNGAGKARFTLAAHGYSDGDIMAICGCADDDYNIIGVVANKATDTFDIETITYVATDTGYSVTTSDSIVANDDFVYPADEIIPFAIPAGVERSVHSLAGMASKAGATQPYQTTPTEVIIVHFKQEISATGSYLKLVEG